MRHQTQRSISSVERVEVFSNLGGINRYDILTLLSKLGMKNLDIYIENRELLEYKLEEHILRNRDNEYYYRSYYEKIDEKATAIETVRFSNDEIEQYRDYELIKKLSKKRI